MEKWSVARGDEWILRVWNGAGAGRDMELVMHEAHTEECDRFELLATFSSMEERTTVSRKL